MSDARLAIVISAKDEASSVLKGITGGLGGLISGAAGLGVAALGLGALTSGIGEIFTQAKASEQGLAQLNQVLKSTHGIAGVTALAAQDLATSLMNVTTFDDDAIQGGENLLLTFTSIGKDVFPAATEAMLNMSQALGQDVKASAIQLGKALNDPIQGATALRRVGVSLTDAQTALIKKFQDAGQIEKAQGVILKELETEFGGAAKAAGQTLGGQLTILQNKLGNAEKAIALALIPTITNLVGAIAPAADWIGEKLPGALDFLGATINSVINPIQDTVRGFLAYLSPTNTVDLMRAWFGPNFGPRIDEVVRTVREVSGVLVNFAGDVQQIVSDLLGGGGLGQFFEDTGNMARSLSEYLSRALPAIGSALGGLGATIFEAARSAVTSVDWAGIWKGAVGIGQGLVTSGLNIASNVGAWIAGQWAALKATDWGKVWANVVGIGSGLLESGLSLTAGIRGWLAGEWAALKATDWGAIWAGAVGIGQGLLTSALNIGTAVATWLKGVWQSIPWADIWAAATTFISGAVTWAKSIDLIATSETIRDTLKAALATIDWKAVGDAVARAVASATAGVNWAAAWSAYGVADVALGGLLASIQQRVGAFGDRVGRTIADAMLIGLKAVLLAAGTVDTNAATFALSLATSILSLPNRLMRFVAETLTNLGITIAEGIVGGLSYRLGPLLDSEIRRVLAGIAVDVGPFHVSGAGVSLTGGAAASIQTTIHQTFNGPADPVQVGQASHGGVMHALRASGIQ